MDNQKSEELKVLQSWIKIILGVLLFLSYGVGIGYNLEKINDHERRIGNVESALEDQSKTSMTKDDIKQQLSEIKEQLNHLDDRIDHLSRTSDTNGVRTFSDRKH